MGDVFAAYHQAAADGSCADQRVCEIDTRKHAGTGVGYVERHRVMNPESRAQPDGGTRLERIAVGTVEPRDVAADHEVDVLSGVLGICKALLHRLDRQVVAEFILTCHAPRLDARQVLDGQEYFAGATGYDFFRGDRPRRQVDTKALYEGLWSFSHHSSFLPA